MKRLYERKMHKLNGKFGSNEALRAMTMFDFMNDLIIYGEGYKLSPRALVTNEIGVIDTELIKDMIQRMFAYCPVSFSEKQKDFYYSYLYCAIALFSVEFEYYEEDRSACYDFPEQAKTRGLTLDFLTLIEYSDVRMRNGSPNFVDSVLVRYMNDFYYLLSGKSRMDRIRPMLHGADDPNAVEPIDESLIADPDRDYYNYSNEELEEAYIPDPPPFDRKVVKERNLLSSKKLKLVYPGYRDYIEMMDQMLSLFDEAASNRFHHNIDELINGYMLCEGKCIYVNEEECIDVMVHLNRARKLLMKSMKQRDPYENHR